MKLNLRRNIASFLKLEDGPTSLEYAVILGAVVVIVITAITSLGNSTNAAAAQKHRTLNSNTGR